jgi:hypothetical protein
MRPTAFGYLSMPVDPSADGGTATMQRWHQQLTSYAREEGLELAGTFADTGGADSAFYALVAQLRREEGPVAVIVPGLDHLAHIGALTGADTRTAARYLQARVLHLPQEQPPP